MVDYEATGDNVDTARQNLYSLARGKGETSIVGPLKYSVKLGEKAAHGTNWDSVYGDIREQLGLAKGARLPQGATLEVTVQGTFSKETGEGLRAIPRGSASNTYRTLEEVTDF